MKQNYILPTIYKETTNDSITANKINNIHKLYDYLKCEYNINIDMCYNQKILYISDLHIETITSILGINAFVKRLKKETQKNCLIDSYSNIFIAGDISREFNYFKAFIKALKKYFKRNNIFIVLGNHELSIEKSEIKNIYDKYKKELNKYKRINLLQNELVGITQNSEVRFFKRFSEINNKVREEYDYFIFGGTGFAGFNEEWNANNLIYGKLEINRAKEISESKAFSESINKVNNILKSKNLIILSHFPIRDCLEIKPHNNVNYYINGHTHRNYMKRLDNNNIIYCNNQLGYYSNRRNKVFLKYFSFDKKFDYLDYLNDGIHNISSTSYKKFLRFKSIHTSKTFSKNEQLYCLKRNNYYLFILKTSKSLCILNKGAKKKLPNKPLEYFYENMNKVIKTIKTPYDKYYELQKKISKEVKNFGGYGYIHGCIIDIDFYNHIFLNPLDSKITPYHATDIINKTVYPSTSLLLKENNNDLYNNYINDKHNKYEIIVKKNYLDKKQKYLSTDIYSINYYFKKMENLQNNILSIWLDDFNKISVLSENNIKLLTNSEFTNSM